MQFAELNRFFDRFKTDVEIFHNLMARRVQKILLVATFYDAFIIEQDGNLAEQILDEYNQLNLTTVPKVTSVPTGEAALRVLEEQPFDLVITMLRIGEVGPFELAERIKAERPALPVVLLLNNESDVPHVSDVLTRTSGIDDVFLWTGDSKLFLAIIKCVEDRLNVRRDTREGFVRVILLVEDTIQYYSRFLPLLYEEIVKQTQRVIGEEYSTAQKTLRMRARPKVLMAHSYEDAVALYERHKDSLLCLISDVSFPHDGEMNEESGLRLVEHIRREYATLPAVIQSSNPRHWGKAHKLQASFLHKHSPQLLKGLKDFLLENCGFGDFVFRSRDGMEIDRAATMLEFEQKLHSIPYESVMFHSDHNHFSAWLMAHGEIQLARHIRPLTGENFSSPAALKEFLARLFRELRLKRTRGKIVDFHRPHVHVENEVLRLAGGSLGGKGRGLAFLNAFLATMELEDRFAGVHVRIPRTAIIGTDEFDRFMDTNKLTGRVFTDDESLKNAFLGGTLSWDLVNKLSDYLQMVTHPIAVRSSSLLEDSQSKPFAGIYQTLMLPNNHQDLAVRLRQLMNAIRLVYASVFSAKARGYIESIAYNVEQEKMAVVIQEVVGAQVGDHYYPHFAGVAESHDFYPAPYMEAKDGVASLCVGLGKYVVDGGDGVRFCPRYPTQHTRLSDEMPTSSQTKFYALDLRRSDVHLAQGEQATLDELPLSAALDAGMLDDVISTFDVESWRLVDGNYGRGPKVVTFSNILHNQVFPLATILDEFLDIGQKAMGVAVELEFAVALRRPGSDELPAFNLLQIRPLARMDDHVPVEFADHERGDILVASDRSMGNGRIEGVQDVVYVLPEAFDTTATLGMRDDIAAVNTRLRDEGRSFILVGPGRWGTRDRFLGIPIQWNDISQVKVIVEMEIPGFPVESSQGTHFFHNLVAMGTGYFTIPRSSGASFVDGAWLLGQSVVSRTTHVVHVRLERPLTILMDGRKGRALVLK